MAISQADIDRIKKVAKQKKNYNKWYGMKKGLLTYLDLPVFLPLKVHLQHGAGMIYRNDVPDPLVLETKYRYIFLCNSYQKNICQQYLPDKNICVSGSVFPLYRQKKGIVQHQNAEGSMFFPVHSTESIQAYDNIDRTLENLAQLPDYLKPIKVSIYYKDLLRGLNKVYEDCGYETFTNGHRNDTLFIDRFYASLKNVKYAFGTTIGSQTYYAVEMGIPYFVIGDMPLHINRNNTYYPEGKIELKDYKRIGYAKFEQARSIFIADNFTDGINITKEQRSFVENSIGFNEKISKRLLKELVLASLFRV